MDLEALRLFLEVADRGSFTAAAKAEGIDASSVSRRIAGLEDVLGFRLFERSTRKIALTEAGASYRDRITPLLTELTSAGAQARDMVESPRGTLRITASTSFGQKVILPILPTFHEACPEVNVQLLLNDRNMSLIDERIDLAIRLSSVAPADTVVSRLMRTHYRIIATPEYWRAHPAKRPEELANHNCLTFPYPGFRDLWKFRNADREINVPIQSRLEISSALALRDVTLAGLGVSILPDWLIGGDLVDGSLKSAFSEYNVTATTFDTGAYILYPSRPYLPLKTRRFINILRQEVKLSTT